MSKEPTALCHLQSHGLSMHTNAECRTQNPSLGPTRSTQGSSSRPMGRTIPPAAPVTSRGLSAISTLTDAEKASLFDHLQTAHANIVASKPNDLTGPSPDNSDKTVYFSNICLAVSQSKTTLATIDEVVLDTGSDQFILNSRERFIDMNPITPITIKTADGSCHLQATHQGDAVIESYDDQGRPHQMIMPGSLYCEHIYVNLISEIRLCDAGCTFEGNSTTITFSHPNGGRLHARRKSNTNELWTVSPFISPTCLSVSTDIMHQRLGKLHSAALRCFCKNGGKSSNICTSCIFAKSHRLPFQSSMPQADRLLYCVHSDVVGPFQTPTPNGNQYFVTFIDEHSRYARVYLLKQKNEVFDVFCQYLSKAESHTGQKLCILKCDRGGKYSSTQFRAFTLAHGILLKQGPAHTPQHNSVAARYNRTIMERCCAQMIHAALPKFLWGEVVMAKSYILNMSPTRTTATIPVNTWQEACAGSGGH